MDIIGKGRVVGYISAVLVVISIVLLFVPGLNLGINLRSQNDIILRPTVQQSAA